MKTKTATKKSPSPKSAKPDKSKSVTMDFDDVDIVVTDPCYLFGRLLWDVMSCGDDTPQEVVVDKTRAIVAGTIWGDWMCKLEWPNRKHAGAFGNFTADAGMVCVAELKDGRYDDKLSKLPGICYTRFPKFTGHVFIRHGNGECRVEGIGMSDGKKIEFVSRQIG